MEKEKRPPQKMSDFLGIPSANAPKLVKDLADTDWNNRMKRMAAAMERERRPPQKISANVL